MGLLAKLQSSMFLGDFPALRLTRTAELELYRLEQKYAKRKNRQTLATGATYVDGEYRYDGGISQPISASSTGSSSSMGKRTSMFLGGKR